MSRYSVPIFARNLNRQLDMRDMTQIELCERLNLRRATVSSWCAGTKFPRIDKIELLADFFGITPAELIGKEQGEPAVTDDVVELPVIADVAAGFEHDMVLNWEGETVEIPRSYLRGRPVTDFFALRVDGTSMYPDYKDGDIVVVLRQTTLNRSGDIGVIRYDGDKATLKKVEFVHGENWMLLVPLNPNGHSPEMIKDADLEECSVLGIPRMVIREIRE